MQKRNDEMLTDVWSLREGEMVSADVGIVGAGPLQGNKRT